MLLCYKWRQGTMRRSSTRHLKVSPHGPWPSLATWSLVVFAGALGSPSSMTPLWDTSIRLIQVFHSWLFTCPRLSWCNWMLLRGLRGWLKEDLQLCLILMLPWSPGHVSCCEQNSSVRCQMSHDLIHDHYLNYYKAFLLQKWRRDDSFWVHSSFYCPLEICLNQLNVRSGGKCGFLLWPKKAFTLDSRSQEVEHQSRLDRLDLRSSSQPLWKA